MNPGHLSVMENGAATQSEGKDPSGFLSEIIGNPVTVKLNSGVVYKGRSLSPMPPETAWDKTRNDRSLTLQFSTTQGNSSRWMDT